MEKSFARKFATWYLESFYPKNDKPVWRLHAVWKRGDVFCYSAWDWKLIVSDPSRAATGEGYTYEVIDIPESMQRWF